MKTSGYLILYISENDDPELWNAFSRISSDERASFVKSALRKALMKDAGNTAATHSSVFRNGNNSGESPAVELALDDLEIDLMAGCFR